MSAYAARYETLALTGVRSREVTERIALHLDRFAEYLEATYGHDRLQTVVRRDVVGWRDSLVSSGLGPSTVNNHLASLAGLCGWVTAHAPGALPGGNPTSGVRTLALAPPEPRALTPEQVRSLKSIVDRLERFHAPKGPSTVGGDAQHGHARAVRDRAIVHVLLSTGLRRGELVMLDLTQVSPREPGRLREAKRARLTAVRGKGGTTRTVFLSADARAALADYLQHERPGDASGDAPAVFLSAVSVASRREGGRLSPRSINGILERIGRWHDAEHSDPARWISPLRPHALRHTFAFALAETRGKDADELERRLGHRSQRYIARYTNPPKADASDTGFLVARTKLSIPLPRMGSRIVARRRLLQLLDEGLSARLTLMCAPTGWGKTTAVAEWATAGDARCAWVSLDPGDNEPLRFWRSVVASLAAAEPASSGVALRRLQSPAVSVIDEILPALVNDLAEVAAPLVLVLDDYQVISAPEIHTQLEYLMSRLPVSVHVVLIAHAEPPLRLGRMRALGELADIGPEQLCFSDLEAGELLNRVHGLDLGPEEVRTLQLKIEGWVAGLNLAAMSLTRDDSRGRSLDALPVNDRFLIDYLWNEVVMSQPRSVRQFLMRTAILERFSAPLADALTGRNDGAEALRELERANLFVVALDRERVWYRYHHLFRSLLLGQLERLAPELIPDLHRAASTWYADQGTMIEAIEHAIAAGDMHYAADELERRWFQFYSAAHFLTLASWIDRLSPDALAAHPILVVVRAGMARILGRTEEIEAWLERVDPASLDAPAPGLASSIAGAVAEVRSLYRLAVGDVAGAIALGRRAVELEPQPGSPQHAAAGYHLGVALFFEDPKRAEPLLREFLTVIPSARHDPRHIYATALLAETRALAGDLDAAERMALTALQATRELTQEEWPSTNQVEIALGAAPLARGELDTAEEHFERAVAMARRGGDRVETAHALVWLAAVLRRQGDGDAGRSAAAAASALVPGLGRSIMRQLVQRLGVELAPAQGGDARARPDEPLSEAELRVLALMPGDLSYREMGARLHLSLNTVRTHALRVRRKLGVPSRSAVVARARELGLL